MVSPFVGESSHCGCVAWQHETVTDFIVRLCHEEPGHEPLPCELWKEWLSVIEEIQDGLSCPVFLACAV